MIPPGPNLLSDTLAKTDILPGDGVGPQRDDGLGGGGESGGAGYEFGMDLSADPELALALRMSFIFIFLNSIIATPSACGGRYAGCCCSKALYLVLYIVGSCRASGAAVAYFLSV